MASILIVYGTAYGQTERVAQDIARVLTESGHEVSIFNGDALPGSLTVDGYEAYVVAGSVLIGRHQGCIRRFVRDHAARLTAVPSAFVSVCGAMNGSDPEGARMAQQYVEKFLQATGWRPALTVSFAGEVAYTRYRPWVRWMMKAISRRTGGPTDTSRDHEFTDWSEVGRFAHRFAELVPGGKLPALATAGDELC